MWKIETTLTTKQHSLHGNNLETNPEDSSVSKRMIRENEYSPSPNSTLFEPTRILCLYFFRRITA